MACTLRAATGCQHTAPIIRSLPARPAPARFFCATITGAALITLLEAHPNLLTYAVSADGKQLEKGQARASVDVAERNGRKVAGVSYWREGASFEGTPVAPYKPSAL